MIRIAAILFLICSFAFADNITNVWPGMLVSEGTQLTTVYAVSGTCTSNTSWYSAASAANFANSASSKFVSSSNRVAYAWTPCKVAYHFKRSGSGTAGTLTAQIREDASGKPGAVIATSLNTISSADVSTNAAWYEFQFDGTVTLGMGTTNWFGVVSSTTSATDFYAADVGTFGTGALFASSDGTTWSLGIGRGWFQAGWYSGVIVNPPVTNSFEMLMNFEGADGLATSTSLSNSVKLPSMESGGSWQVGFNNSAYAYTDSFAIATFAANSFPSNFWWTNSLVADAGTNGLAIRYQTTTGSGGSTNTAWTYTLPVPLSTLSFGLYITINTTNTPAGNSWFNDMVYFDDAGGVNTSIIEYRCDTNSFYAHGGIAGIGFTNGAMCGSNSIPSTNWVTGLITPTNYTLRVYNLDWTQFGQDSFIERGNTPITKIKFFDYMRGATNMPFCTNYFDNLVIKTNGLFPIIPTNFPAMNHPGL